MIVAVGIALVAYAFDCGPTMTAEQAMQCCNAMPCSPHGHEGQDCCRTMSAVHAPFVQPSSVQGTSLRTVAVAILPAGEQARAMDWFDRLAAPQSHAPPIFGSLKALPLRI